MILSGKNVLFEFVQRYPEVKKWVNTWIADVEGNIWNSKEDIRRLYPSADFIGNMVIVFNVKGNSFRLEATVAYKTSVVKVIWGGTHADYDKRNKKYRGNKNKRKRGQK